MGYKGDAYYAEKARKESYERHEKALEMAANANGYSINDPTIGITGYWDQRREAETDLAIIIKNLFP